MFDLKDLELAPALGMLEFAKPGFALLDLFAAESVEAVYIVNAPSFFRVIYNVLAPVIPAGTKKRLKILGSDFTKASKACSLQLD